MQKTTNGGQILSRRETPYVIIVKIIIIFIIW